MNKYTIKTERLGLRNWQDSDFEPMAALCLDPKVMEFFPSTQPKEHTEKFIKRMQKQFEERGHCYFAVDRLDKGTFIGFIGLCYQFYKSDFTPGVDIGWRLQQAAWGNGFATEGAKACLNYAFMNLKLSEVFAITPILNVNSEKVMKKIGMVYERIVEPPQLATSPELKKCVLYRIPSSFNTQNKKISFYS